MAKTYGGIRNVGVVKISDYAINRAMFDMELASGKYDIEKSYFSDTGAYVLFEKGHRYHADEIDVAIALADNGIIVKMTSEGGATNITALTTKGTNKYSEGKLGIEELTYEQATREKQPEPGDAYKAVNNAIEHAKKKGADVAVIYDKHGYFHRGDIQAGITKYESHKSNTHRFKAILVVSQDHHVFEWTHDKK